MLSPSLIASCSILNAFCCLTILPTRTLSQSFNSLISLSELIASDPGTSTKGNVNIIETGGDGNDFLPICYVPYLMLFSFGDGIPSNAFGQYDGVAAALLAMEHLNTGNGTIVQEISGMNQRCPLRFTTKAFDTEHKESVGVEHVVSMTDRSITDQLLPCAILGAGYSRISMTTSLISGIRGFPQISPLSTSSALDDTNQFKLFGRTIPNDDGTAIPLLAKIREWNVNFLAVLHIDDPYGNAYAEGIRLHAQKQYPNLRVVTVNYAHGADDSHIYQAVKLLRDTQFKFFFGILNSPADADRIMSEAYHQGIAGTGKHTWLFSNGANDAPLNRYFPVGSPLGKAYGGAGILSAAGGIQGMVLFDKFERFMQQLARNKRDLSFLAAHLPKGYLDGKELNHSLVTSQESFLIKPGFIAPFVYDAVVAIGLAACQLVGNSDGDDFFTGEELFDSFLNTTFEGTTGPIILNKETGTRDPQSASFILTNFIDDQAAHAGQGKTRFKGLQTDFFKSGEWESLASYTFNDGTRGVPPDLAPLETNANYLSSGLRAVGLVLCGIVVVMALSSSVWTFHNSKQRVVRSSQPIFLHIISAGTLLMGLSIIPLTIDEGVTNEGGADKACMSFPWLVVTGFSLTFSALFTKTHRINQIMQSAAKCKRMKLTAVDVMKPMAALLLLNIIVLAIWTGVDPLERQTIVVAQDPFFRDIETYGVCNSEHSSIFLAVLGMINLGSLLFAVFQAYRARNMSTELQESSYIFMAMALIVFVSFLGIPVMVIARDNVAASYFVTAGLVFVVCTSILLLIFIPKVRALRRTNQHHSLREIAAKVKSNRWTTSPNTMPNRFGDEEGMEIRNELEHKEQENLKLKHEIERLLANERKLIQKVEQLTARERTQAENIANDIYVHVHPEQDFPR